MQPIKKNELIEVFGMNSPADLRFTLIYCLCQCYCNKYSTAPKFMSNSYTQYSKEQYLWYFWMPTFNFVNTKKHHILIFLQYFSHKAQHFSDQQLKFLQLHLK